MIMRIFDQLKKMSELFNVKPNIISYHLNGIYESKEFYKNTQNKLHYAITGNTAYIWYNIENLL